ncbi:response regulator [Geomonas subterranea]|uniref:Response regulator n=1 Tax=Geomonas subterranea TaxID=2847989 RepID=A0ABX8LLB5_9BACT|nr:response regulator [Geomonas subterranea]QXE91013.1 response regulator [Geomonas subterranea]QXM10902.1 response regulator [Geomonas subterranea]
MQSATRTDGAVAAQGKGKNLPRVLVVDDEVSVLRFLRAALPGSEFTLFEAENGHAALAAAAAVRPDIILQDLGLPDLDGVEVIKRIREWSQVPIIVLSVRDSDDDKVGALDAGADDYLIKPFSIAELQARIRVSLRRSLQQAPEPVYRCGELEVDLPLRRVRLSGKEVVLTPTEYELLRLLVTHAGRVLTHSQLLKQIWGVAHVEQQNVLRVTIRNLRQKIEHDPSRPYYITTEVGVGYRLRSE